MNGLIQNGHSTWVSSCQTTGRQGWRTGHESALRLALALNWHMSDYLLNVTHTIVKAIHYCSQMKWSFDWMLLSTKLLKFPSWNNTIYKCQSVYLSKCQKIDLIILISIIQVSNHYHNLNHKRTKQFPCKWIYKILSYIPIISAHKLDGITWSDYAQSFFSSESVDDFWFLSTASSLTSPPQWGCFSYVKQYKH